MKKVECNTNNEPPVQIIAHYRVDFHKDKTLNQPLNFHNKMPNMPPKSH